MGKIRRNQTKRTKSRPSGNRRPKACKKVHTNKKRKAARRRTFRKKCMKKCMKTYKGGGLTEGPAADHVTKTDQLTGDGDNKPPEGVTNTDQLTGDGKNDNKPAARDHGSDGHGENTAGDVTIPIN